MDRFLTLFFISFFALQSKGQSNFELVVKNKIDHITTLAREPMIAEHPNGNLFLTGYRNASDIPQLWKSTDLGKNWVSVNVGTYEMGAQGNSDVDLYIDEEGDIYFLSMTYTKVPSELEGFDFSSMKGEQITLGISRDAGETWDWQTISKSNYDDRPWITSTSNGDLHIIWNDGNGVHHKISNDKGRTWLLQPKIYPKGGSSFLASGYNNQLAVRVSPLSASGGKFDEGIDLIRLSIDNGKTWQDVKLPGTRIWTQDFSNVPRWVEPLAWNKKDRIYTLWSEGKTLKLGISPDFGKTWQEHVVINDQDTLYYPYMKIDEDNILCSWVSGFNKNIKHHAAILKLDNKELTVHRIEPQKLDIWSRFAVGDYQRSTGGEYFPIIQLSNGNIGMVTTIQNQRADRFGFTWWELILNEF